MCKNLDLGLHQALVQAPVMMMRRMAGKLQHVNKKENGLVVIQLALFLEIHFATTTTSWSATLKKQELWLKPMELGKASQMESICK